MKALKIIIATLILLLIAAPAFAVSLSHSPTYRYVTIPAGSEAPVPITVTISGVTWGTYDLLFVDSIDGNLPMEWITPTKESALLSRFWNSDSTTLQIAVPINTKQGTYASYVYSKATQANEYADPGTGILIEVSVPSNCSGKPTVDITSLSPDIIWPPNRSKVLVTITGKVSMPSGCTLNEVGYSVEDEYGAYTGVGKFSVNGSGEFTVRVPVEAWREMQDTDGRIYKVKFFAENDAGIGTSAVLDIIVPHSQGKSMKSK